MEDEEGHLHVIDEEDDELSHYFGDKARANFFDRHKWLNHQTEISLANLKDPLDASYLSHTSEHHLPSLSGRSTPAKNERSSETKHERKTGLLIHDDHEEWTSHGIASPEGAGHGTPHKKVYKFGSPTKQKVTPKPPKPVLPALATNRLTPSEHRSAPNSRNNSRGPSPTFGSPVRSSPALNPLSLHKSPLPTPGEKKSIAEKEDYDDFSITDESSLVNEDFTAVDEDDFQAISPRTKFLASCIKEKINPRPSLLLRKNETTKLNLQHQGMNDQMAKAFAKSLQSMADIDSINIADNRLTDIGLTPILLAILDVHELKELNLSQNIIGPQAAKALNNYLSSKDCQLEKLILNSSNVDDLEVAHFIHAIEKNGNLLELDLSNNEIGKNEKAYSNQSVGSGGGHLQPLHLTSVSNTPAHSAPSTARKGSGAGLPPPVNSSSSPLPHHTLHDALSSLSATSSSTTAAGSSKKFTGPHAIAELLRSSTCKLQKLNLQWNLIRLDGAIDLMKSLAINETLVYLDLSYNSLAAEGAIALGMSLIKNNSLETLILSYNSIDSVGCIAICAGVIENRRLKKLVLDGNPIGETGAKALLMLPILSIREVEVSVAKCNVSIKDSKCWFHFNHLIRDYRLDMENGFDRAVFIFLLHIVAGHQSFRFSQIEYEPSHHQQQLAKTTKPSSAGQHHSTTATGRRPLNLISFLSIETQNYFTPKQTELLQTLERIESTFANYANAINWFEEVDDDGSGLIEYPEFSLLMKKLGMDNVSEKRLHQLMKKYDLDNSGTMDRTEFLLFLKQQKQDSSGRMMDLLNVPMMMETSPPSNHSASLSGSDHSADHEAHPHLGMLQIGTEELDFENLSGTNTNGHPDSFHYLPPETGIFYVSVVNHCNDSADSNHKPGQPTSNSFTKATTPHTSPNQSNRQQKKKHFDYDTPDLRQRLPGKDTEQQSAENDDPSVDDESYNFRILTSTQCESIMKLIKQLGSCSNLIALVSAAISIVKLRFIEAITLADWMLIESADKIIISEKILLQMNDTNDTGHFLQCLFGDNRQEVMRFKWEYGFLLKPLLGCPNGYYSLDLSKDVHRKCFFKLLEINNLESERRMKYYQKYLSLLLGMNSSISRHHLYHFGDLSQKNNFFCFRNEIFNGIPTAMNSSFIHSLPLTGKLEFDFTSSERPNKDCHIINDRKFLKLLYQYGLLALPDLPLALWKLEERKQRNIEALALKGYDNEGFLTPERAHEISLFMESFYEHLSLRASQYQEAREKICRPLEHLTSPQALTRDHAIVLPTELANNPNAFLYDPTLQEDSTFQEFDKFVKKKLGESHVYSRLNYGKKPEEMIAPRSHEIAPNSNLDKFFAEDEEKNEGDNHEVIQTLKGIFIERNDPTNKNNSKKGTTTPVTKGKGKDAQPQQQQQGKKLTHLLMESDNKLKKQAQGHGDDEDAAQQKEEEEAAVTLFNNKIKVRLPSQIALDTKKESSINLLKLKQETATTTGVNISDTNSDDDDEELVDESAQPISKEVFDWFQEHNLLKKVEEDQLHRMKSGRMNDFMRRLSFLRDKNFFQFPNDQFLKKFHAELQNKQVQAGLKAHKLVDLLEEVFARTYLYCRHLALILDCFVPFGSYKQTQFFGTYRVELVIGLFSRLIDIHNFEIVMEALSPQEAACVYCRLGYLHVFNPTKPEGSWEFDLSRREERIIVKMLCILGIYEPGNNFLNETFRWARDLDPLGGWELTNSWLTEEGLPNKGILSLTYYSGEGKELHGCKPFINFRKSLLNLVLINEDEIVDEEFRSKPRDYKKLLPGEKAFLKYINVWETYLAPVPPSTTGLGGKKKKTEK